jgi:hypothetical protein
LDLLDGQMFLMGELLLALEKRGRAAETFRQSLEQAEKNGHALLAYRCRLYLAGLGEGGEGQVQDRLNDLRSGAKDDQERVYAGYHLCLYRGSPSHKEQTLELLNGFYRRTPVYEYGQMITVLSRDK